MFVWDERKRISNIEKHGLDFRDAHLVYDDSDKLTYHASYKDEVRQMDLALVVIKGRVVPLVYTERGDDVRVISFRPASREERKQYEEDK